VRKRKRAKPRQHSQNQWKDTTDGSRLFPLNGDTIGDPFALEKRGKKESGGGRQSNGDIRGQRKVPQTGPISVKNFAHASGKGPETSAKGQRLNQDKKKSEASRGRAGL